MPKPITGAGYSKILLDNNEAGCKDLNKALKMGFKPASGSNK